MSDKPLSKATLKYKVGDIVETSTFAGPKVHIKVSKLVDRKSSWNSLDSKDSKDIVHVNGFYGHFVRRKDVLALKKAAVPYTGKERPKDVEGFTFDWQVTKIIKRGNRSNK